MKLRRIVFAIAALAGVAAAHADQNEERILDAQAVTVSTITDMRQESGAARAQALPILVMFGAEHCPYCELVERHFLKPMIYSGDYKERVLIRRVRFDETAVVDFDGKPTTGRELGRRYGVKVTPTVVFLNDKGEQVADKMVGVGTPDYYGGYLDAAIDRALGKVRHNAAVVAREGVTRLD